MPSPAMHPADTAADSRRHGATAAWPAPASRVVLASASPRRRQLLAEAGVPILVDVAAIDETALPDEAPVDHVLRLALAKAEAVARRHPRRVVLGADTVVVLDGRIFGKPADLDEARAILRQLSGRWHEVLTGVALRRRRPTWKKLWCARTRVRFHTLSEAAIEDYCQRVNTLDKAGAYGIQEHGDRIIAAIDGLRSTVVGLPVEEVVAALAQAPISRERNRKKTAPRMQRPAQR